MGRPSVFISYTSHDDRDRATAWRLAGGLRELGADVWIAPGSIPPGDEWRESLIREVLSKATHFLVLLSTASVTANWVLTEIALARDRYEGDLGFRVLPLVTGLLGDYRGREFLDRFQRVPYRDAFPRSSTRWSARWA